MKKKSFLLVATYLKSKMLQVFKSSKGTMTLESLTIQLNLHSCVKGKKRHFQINKGLEIIG